MKSMVKFFGIIAFAAVIALLAACDTGGSGTPGNGTQPCTGIHVWGDWARVSPGDHSIQQTRRTCMLGGCNEQQIFTPGSGHVQASLTVPGVYRNKYMVRIPAGSIMGGIFGTTHITQSHDFWMSRHQVTRAQWHYVMGTLPWGGAASDADNRAATQIGWFDAIEFANRLSHERGLTPVYSIAAATAGPGFGGVGHVEIGQQTTYPGRWGTSPASGGDLNRWNAVEQNLTANGYRLPTSAQWEYAARAGTTTDFNDGVTNDWQNNTAAIRELAWFSLLGAGDNPGGVQPVGLLRPNAWGLYDMHGNVWEWCWDASDANRVIRGGSWGSGAGFARSSLWVSEFPWGGLLSIGFRLVRHAN